MGLKLGKSKTTLNSNKKSIIKEVLFQNGESVILKYLK